MKKLFTNICLVALVAFVLFSCDTALNSQANSTSIKNDSSAKTEESHTADDTVKATPYTSIDAFNENPTLAKTVVVTLGELELGTDADSRMASNSELPLEYQGNGILIGSTELNDEGKTPEEYNAESPYTYTFKDGTLTNSVTGYKIYKKNAVVESQAIIYMLLPANSDVVFENITFNGVFSFDHQKYTAPYSFLNSITFKNCTFNGLVVGDCPSIEVTFDGCTFNEYTNTMIAGNSFPVWMSSEKGGIGGTPASMQKVTFKNNKVAGIRPIKLSNVGINYGTSTYTAELTFIDNYFDIKNEDNESHKNMGIYINQYDNAPIVIVDDRNEISDDTFALYTGDYYEISGTKVLDSNGDEKTITAAWYGAYDETEVFTISSVE